MRTIHFENKVLDSSIHHQMTLVAIQISIKILIALMVVTLMNADPVLWDKTDKKDCPEDATRRQGVENTNSLTTRPADASTSPLSLMQIFYYHIVICGITWNIKSHTQIITDRYCLETKRRLRMWRLFFLLFDVIYCGQIMAITRSRPNPPISITAHRRFE